MGNNFGSDQVRVLVVDDDDVFREGVKANLEYEGYGVLTASDGEEGIGKLKSERNIRVLLLDLFMPGLSGEEVLYKVRNELEPKSEYGKMPVIIITADRYGDMETQMRLLNEGADRFMVKPVTADEILSAIAELIRPPQDYVPIGWAEAPYDETEDMDELQGRSASMVKLGNEIKRIAATDTSVLILGEVGTGKELIAEILHRYSDRKGHFVAVDCFGLPNYELMYSEIWGHEGGLFPGTVERSPGCVGKADNGTLFLNEIAILDNRIQDHLLRFLRSIDGLFYPLGSGDPHSANVRVIAATRMDLEEAIDEGRFQEDLYHHLSQEMIRVPPLRERRAKTGATIPTSEKLPTSDDLEILVDYAIDRYNKTRAGEAGKKIFGIEITALDVLKGYEWPGNVRQLNNVINEAISKALERRTEKSIITEGDIKTSRLFDTFPGFALPVVNSLENLYDKMMDGDQTDERHFAYVIEKILNIAEGKSGKAAEIGGVTKVVMEKYIAKAREINSRSHSI